jgi:carboxymethylenebutenolidase
MEVVSQKVEIPAPGGAMPAELVRPKGGGKHPAVLVIMEAFGLNDHIRDVARRIAAEGYVALAPDVYYRLGKGCAAGYGDLQKAIGWMTSLKDDEIVADLKAAITHLEKQDDVRADRIGITGFCMGGRISYLAAAEIPDGIKATAPFYGGGIAIDRTAKVKAPVLAFFGEKDGFIPLSVTEELRAALQREKKQGEVIVYPGADHGFFCNERASYQKAAADDSWRRLKDFFAKHLKA